MELRQHACGCERVSARRESASLALSLSRSLRTLRSLPSSLLRLSPPCSVMQSAPRPPAQQQQQQPVKIYNAVYSSVQVCSIAAPDSLWLAHELRTRQVYECMVRGIAVMRRRADSYVNATQILKVAGVDKGRRTKILEKEILPGKHEIVQGGYGKYQGTS